MHGSRTSDNGSTASCDQFVGCTLNLEGKLEFPSFDFGFSPTYERLSSIYTNSSHAYCYE